MSAAESTSVKEWAIAEVMAANGKPLIVNIRTLVPNGAIPSTLATRVAVRCPYPDRGDGAGMPTSDRLPALRELEQRLASASSIRLMSKTGDGVREAIFQVTSGDTFRALITRVAAEVGLDCSIQLAPDPTWSLWRNTLDQLALGDAKADRSAVIDDLAPDLPEDLGAELAARTDELSVRIEQLEAERDYRGAAAVAEEFVEVVRARRPRDQEFATVLHTCGRALCMAGRCDDAERVLREGIEVVGDDRPLVRAALLYQLGGVCGILGHHDEAIGALSESNSLIQKHHAPTSVEVIQGVEALAMAFNRTGNHIEAEFLLRACLRAIEERGGTPHEIGHVVLNLAKSIKVRNGDAFPDLERALALLESVTGHERVTLAEVHSSMAELKSSRGDHAAAEEHMREALLLRIELLGSDHPSVAIEYWNLALTFEAASDLERAIAACQRAAEIRRARLAPDDPMRLETEKFLADLLIRRTQN